MMKNKKRISIVFVVAAAMVLISMTSFSKTYAANGKTLLQFYTNANCTVTNAEREYLTYKEWSTTGTMPINWINFTDGGISLAAIQVNSSNSYTYENHTKNDIYFSVLGGTYGRIEAKNCTSATIATEDDERHLTVEGKNVQFSIATVAANNGGNGINITGKADSKVEVQDTKNGIAITGAKGKCILEVNDLKDKKDSLKTIAFVPYADPVIIKLPAGKPVKLTGACKIHNNTKKGVRSLHILTPQPTTTFLTWHKVKGAKGYDVLRYDSKKKSYQLIKTLKGKSANYTFDRDLEKGKVYSYKIQPYKDAPLPRTNGIEPKVSMKRSYYVKAIVGSDTKGNAKKIAINKKGTVKKKAGKTLKLKATVTAKAGKILYSDKVRWYSSNKKIATVDKNGKVKFKKKGKCQILAKAHNGLNSKALKIVVL